MPAYSNLFKIIDKTIPATSESNIEMFRRMKFDENVRQEIFMSNLKLVVFECLRYKSKVKKAAYEFDDMIMHAMFGLYKAISLFDCERNTKFASYAGYWIRAFIYKFIERQHQVYVPSSTRKTHKKKNEPIQYVYMMSSMPEDEEGYDRFCAENLEDETEHFVDLLDKQDIKNMVMMYVNTLNDRDKDVLIKRFGLNNIKAMTLQEMSVEAGVTREAIRIREKAALNKIKRKMTSDKMFIS